MRVIIGFLVRDRVRINLRIRIRVGVEVTLKVRIYHWSNCAGANVIHLYRMRLTITIFRKYHNPLFFFLGKYTCYKKKKCCRSPLYMSEEFPGGHFIKRFVSVFH